MAANDYNVKVKKTREIPTGEKQTLQLIDKSSGEVLKEQNVSFSSEQLGEEAYKSRIRTWKENVIKNLETNTKDREGEVIEV